MVEQVERDAGRGSNVAVNLAAAGGAGLTLGLAPLVLPLGWFGVVVTSVALALGLAFCGLAVLAVRSRAGLQPHGGAVAAATPPDLRPR